jgi:hypothetical protein
MAFTVASGARPASAQVEILEVQRILASDGESSDGFGSALDVEGEVLIVGVPSDDDLGTNSGSAYIYRFDGAQWIFEQKLHASDGKLGAGFGSDVAVDGDIAIVGAPADDANCPGVFLCGSGASYVFRFDGTTWNEEDKLVAPDGGRFDGWGFAVGVSGDAVLMTAINHDSCPTNDFCDWGAGYVFRFDGLSWQVEQKLAAAMPGRGDNAGFSADLEGDIAILGARRFDGGRGAVLVFRYDGAFWSEEAALIASSTAPIDFLGESSALSGNRVLGGARNFPDGGVVGSGGAFSFQFDGVAWNEEPSVSPAVPIEFDGFGSEVALSGDLAVFGVPLNDDLCPPTQENCNSGTVYAFEFDGTEWLELAKFTSAETGPNEAFGSSVALQGTTAFIGVPGRSAAAGAVYVFDIRAQDPVDLLDELIQQVEDLTGPLLQALLTLPLRIASIVLTDGNPVNDGIAVGSLQAFIAIVDGLPSFLLSPEDAEALIGAAQEIVDLLTS